MNTKNRASKLEFIRRYEDPPQNFSKSKFIAQNKVLLLTIAFLSIFFLGLVKAKNTKISIFDICFSCINSFHIPHHLDFPYE